MTNIVEIVIKAVDKSKEGLDEAEKHAKEHGSRLKGILSTAGTMAGGALVAGLSAAFEAGSKLQEATGRLKVSVENAGGSWEKYQPILATATGNMAKLGFNSDETATALGTLTTMTGSAKMGAKSLADAADYARYKHISLAASAAIVGKAEEGSTKAFKELGIQLTATQLKHLKLESAQKRAADVMDLIHNKVKGQADDYGKTLPGKLDIMKASFENIAATVGQKLIPPITNLLQFLLKYIKPIGAIVAVIGTAIIAFKLWTIAVQVWSAISKIALLTNPWTLLFAAIAAGIFLIIKYHKQIWEFIKRVWGDIWNFIKNLWNTILDFAKQWWPLLLGPSGLIMKYHTQIFDGIKRIWNAIFGWLKDLWNKIFATAKLIWGYIEGFFKLWWRVIKDLFTLNFNDMNTVGQTKMGRFSNIIQNILNNLKQWIWNDFLLKIINFFKNAWDRIWSAAKDAWSNIIGWFRGIPGRVLDALSSLAGKMLHLGAAAMNALWKGLRGVAGHIISWLSGLVSKIGGFFSHLLGFGGGGGSGGGPGGGAPSANAALARRMVPAWGSGAQWNAWNNLEMREAGWNQYARNPTSGAYGIPQALPPTKMPFAAQAAGGSNPAAQIGWMASYIRGRYGSPINAWAHEQAFNWYGGGLQGGVFSKPTLIGVGERGPERVDIAPVGGGGRRIVLDFRGGSNKFDRFLMDWIKENVRVSGGGDVQVAFGSR